MGECQIKSKLLQLIFKAGITKRDNVSFAPAVLDPRDRQS